MKKWIYLLIGLVIIGNFRTSFSEPTFTIPEEAIRLRVIPNSNSIYDQQIKLEVKEELQTKMYELLKDTKGVEDARTKILNELPYIDQEMNTFLKNRNYQEGYTIDYGYHFFPQKEFQGVIYEEGEYESLLITLGKGEGENWWCVLFPPLCLIEAEESEEVEYRFFLQELIEKYL